MVGKEAHRALEYNRGQFYTPAAVDRPMDIIFIDEMRAETWVGIYPREKAVSQTVEISLQIGVSTASAGASDDIRDTVDYAVVVERVRVERDDLGGDLAHARQRVQQRHLRLRLRLDDLVTGKVAFFPNLSTQITFSFYTITTKLSCHKFITKSAPPPNALEISPTEVHPPSAMM
jgi:dihydroneopterin aldolase